MRIDRTPTVWRLARVSGSAVSADLCLAAVSAALGVSPADIAASTRGRAEIAKARHIAIYLQHVAFGSNFSSCGRLFARDRTSIRHACARIEDARDEDRFDHALTRLERALEAQRDMLSGFADFYVQPIGDDR